ncbi:MAG TPA: VTT domain-containing protein [Trueperaceae bacterium]|nr:VTT domain-containing protein [Trueperaceae bacterium]
MTEALSHFINDAGWLAPLYYVASFLATALLPFIPTPLVGALGGKAFGFLAAVAYGIIGLGLGALVGLLLARKIGRPILRLLVRRDALEEWEELIGIRSVALWGVVFFLLNLDFVVLLSGLTSLPLAELWVAAMIARTPWLVASAWFGSAVLVSDTLMWVALVLLVPLLVLLNRLRPRIRRWLMALRPERARRKAPEPPASTLGPESGHEADVSPEPSSRDS